MKPLACRFRNDLNALPALVLLVCLTTMAGFAQQPVDPTLMPKYLDAAKLYLEADGLRREGTGESMRAAILKLKAAAALFRETGSRTDESATLDTIGAVYNDLGERQEALEYFRQSLPIKRIVGDKEGEAATLSNLAVVYVYLGQMRKALEYFSQALPIDRGIGDKRGEAETLNNLGDVYRSLGQMQKALEHDSQALLIQRVVGDKSGEAKSLTGIGLVYYDLGEMQKALEYYTQALPILRAVGELNGEATVLNNQGSIYLSLGDFQKALEYFNQALQIRRAIGHKRGEAVTLNNIGLAYGYLGKPKTSLEYFSQVLPIRRAFGDKSGEAATLNNLGGAYTSLGDTQAALQYFGQALPIWRAVGDKSGEALALSNIGHLYQSLGENQLSVSFRKRSVNLFQELRESIKGLEKEIQKTYLKTVAITYRRLADVLIVLGRIAEAEQVLGMMKEEEYFSYLRREDKVAADLKSRISLSPDEKRAFDDYEKFADGITRSAADLGVLEKKKNGLPLGESLSTTDQKQFDALKAKYDAAVTVFNKFLDDLKSRFGQKDVRVAIVESDTQGLLKKLNEPHTVIISTIVGEDRLNLILTTPNIQKAHTVDIKADDLNRLVAEFRNVVRNPKADPRSLGKKLYDTIFPAALKKDLANINADTIVWSLDGTLRYVPMAALWDGEKYLAERYKNAILTLASRDKLGPPTRKLGSRVFGVGVSKPYEKFSALPAVPRELCSVVDDPKKKEFCKPYSEKTGVMNGMMLADDEFTLAGFQNNLGKTGIVHIASHFSLNAGNEIDSYLLLGGGTERRFTLDNLKKTRLDNVDLLTLSACNTAMASGNNSSGVEIEGFGALAQKQGARSILATLWSVADESTSMFMSEFYRLKQANPLMSKTEAIRLTQKEMIDGKIKATGTSTSCRADDFVETPKKDGFKCDPNAPFSHPYFWSPFILIGNWR